MEQDGLHCVQVLASCWSFIRAVFIFNSYQMWPCRLLAFACRLVNDRDNSAVHVIAQKLSRNCPCENLNMRDGAVRKDVSGLIQKLARNASMHCAILNCDWKVFFCTVRQGFSSKIPIIDPPCDPGARCHWSSGLCHDSGQALLSYTLWCSFQSYVCACVCHRK